MAGYNDRLQYQVTMPGYNDRLQSGYNGRLQWKVTMAGYKRLQAATSGLLQPTI